MVILAGCGGDSTGPGGNGGGTDLSASEQAALTQALGTGGAIGGDAAAYSAVIFGQIKSYGTMSTQAAAAASVAAARQLSLSMHGAGEYSAVGMELKIRAKFQTGEGTDTTVTEVLSGVVGWDGLDVNAKTVDHIIAAYALGEEFPTAGESADFGSEDEAGASYYDRATQSHYEATAGSISLSSSSFGGSSRDCSTSAQGVTISCSAVQGTMQGAIHFDAEKVAGGSSVESFSLGNTSWDVPAVRITMDLDLSNATFATPKFSLR